MGVVLNSIVIEIVILKTEGENTIERSSDCTLHTVFTFSSMPL